MSGRTIVWFRDSDLRVADHRALHWARERGTALFVYVVRPEMWQHAHAGDTPHRRSAHAAALFRLAEDVKACGSRLLFLVGEPAACLADAVRRLRADMVVSQQGSDPAARALQRHVQESLDVPLRLFDGETLLPLGSVRSGQGGPYSVFTAFAKTVLARAPEVGSPLEAPLALAPPPADVAPEDFRCPEFLETALRGALPGGSVEARATSRLLAFLGNRVGEYDVARDRLDQDGTSGLSADLHFGTISVRTAWSLTRSVAVKREVGRDVFCKQLIWREFAKSTLWDRPELLSRPFRASFEGFPWESDEAAFDAWKVGATGYPVVDAAARELLATGFVHNRARMIAASFLTKHLMLDWRLGEEHYLRHLRDADLANNNLGWQWSAGCGCDAQPYFRVFNPVLQGQKFDPDGAYVRRWVPELAAVDKRYVHEPWRAPSEGLFRRSRGDSYPPPIVEHAEARDRFLRLAEAHVSHGSGHGSGDNAGGRTVPRQKPGGGHLGGGYADGPARRGS